MFAAQVTGTIARSVEPRETKFGKAHVFGVETKNKKGERSFINCIQYGEQCKAVPLGSLVYVSGEIDVGQYKGKTSINMLSRNLEILKAEEATAEKEVDDEMPF
jgi:single-stranded DNA-binding protein